MNLTQSFINGFLFAIGLSLLGSAVAQESVIKKRLSESVPTGSKIVSVEKTPISGIYEVIVDNEILYTDSKANYLFFGEIVEKNTKRNLTKEKLDQITKIDFEALPLSAAIKTQRGDGSRTIAVFSDPNCGYCKRLEEALIKIDNLTVYTFPLNILSKNSLVISKNIWCSENPSKSWTEWMTQDKKPSEAPESCSYDGRQVFLLAKKYDITGTPVIVLKNGQRLVGLPTEENLKAAIATSK